MAYAPKGEEALGGAEEGLWEDGGKGLPLLGEPRGSLPQSSQKNLSVHM